MLMFDVDVEVEEDISIGVSDVAVSFDVGVDEDVVGGRHGESDVELGNRDVCFFFSPRHVRGPGRHTP